MATSSHSLPGAAVPANEPGDACQRTTRWGELFWILVLLLVVVAFGVTVTRASWLCDDAYITFRSVDNLVHGYGPVWNTHERVQAFSHPLWMGLLGVFYAFTGEFYVTAQVLSIVLSLAAVVLIGVSHARTLAAGVLMVLACLFSRAFVDYSTSGLENPLTHLLLAVLALVWFGASRGRRTVITLSVLTGLATLNRMDALLLFSPCLAVAMVEARTWRALLWAGLGMSPLIVWFLFATWYYGTPLPNTAYAKLGTGLANHDLVSQGLAYYVSMLARDPVTILVIAAGLLLPFVLRDWRALPLACGALLYALYVVRIGGDFMLGRFLSAPFFIGCIVLARLRLDPRTLAPAAGVIVLMGFMAPYPTVLAGTSYGRLLDATRDGAVRDVRRVSDQRGCYYAATALLRGPQNGWDVVHRWAKMGETLESKVVELDEGDYLVNKHGAIGFIGYCAGPEAIIVDYFGLADPLLARLPMRPGQDWISGHYRRVAPAGYLKSLRAGDNLIEDPDLHSYYDTVRLVTQGSLWSGKRLWAIWRLNTGAEQHLVDGYMTRAFGDAHSPSAVRPDGEHATEGEKK